MPSLTTVNKVKRSLDENDLTVVSIFVNPTQFAPHEDLASYPRTLPADLDALASVSGLRTPSLVFAPTATEMYPSFSESGSDTGAYVDAGRLGSLMEGASRPSFFHGVATVVTKLFNIIQPSRTYFGQKDIQQALLLRRLVADLRFAYPTPETLHIVPTARDPESGLALSSRNAYLDEREMKYAPTLIRALREGEGLWTDGQTKGDVLEHMKMLLENKVAEAKQDSVDMRVDYVEMNDPWTFEVVGSSETMSSQGEKHADVVILSGALWVGKTRLIDNILLGNINKIIS